MCPGVIQTNFGGAQPDEVVKEILEPTIAATPLGRPGQREEVAELVCFLSSRRASYMTGCCVTVFHANLSVLIYRLMVGILQHSSILIISGSIF